MKKTNLEQIIELGKKGLNVHQIAEKINLGVKGVYYHLNANKVKLKDLTKTPQLKAWDTRNKQKAIDNYNNAKSAGIKASISRTFKKEFGIDLKGLINPIIENVATKVVKVKKAKIATTNKSYSEAQADVYIPYSLRKIIEAQDKRIEAQDKRIEAQDKRIEALELLFKKKK
jgi:hypothetical protein